MYSSGSPEGGSDSSENRGEFLEKLQVMETGAYASHVVPLKWRKPNAPNMSFLLLVTCYL
jgi:hypothetical protein